MNVTSGTLRPEFTLGRPASAVNFHDNSRTRSLCLQHVLGLSREREAHGERVRGIQVSLAADDPRISRPRLSAVNPDRSRVDDTGVEKNI